MIKNKKSKTKKLKYALVILLALALAAGAAYWWQNYRQGDQDYNTRTIGPNTKGNLGTENAENQSADSSTDAANDKTPAGSADPSADLKKPVGDLVSNHQPNLDGKPAPSTLESVCITTPGASCSISFTKDGIIKELPAQTADAEGAVDGNWKLQDYDLTEGTWSITAKATLGGQTKTAEDPLKLKVMP
jgi:hypothetical protein